MEYDTFVFQNKRMVLANSEILLGGYRTALSDVFKYHTRPIKANPAVHDLLFITESTVMQSVKIILYFFFCHCQNICSTLLSFNTILIKRQFASIIAPYTPHFPPSAREACRIFEYFCNAFTKAFFGKLNAAINLLFVLIFRMSNYK